MVQQRFNGRHVNAAYRSRRSTQRVKGPWPQSLLCVMLPIDSWIFSLHFTSPSLFDSSSLAQFNGAKPSRCDDKKRHVPSPLSAKTATDERITKNGLVDERTVQQPVCVSPRLVRLVVAVLHGRKGLYPDDNKQLWGRPPIERVDDNEQQQPLWSSECWLREPAEMSHRRNRFRLERNNHQRGAPSLFSSVSLLSLLLFFFFLISPDRESVCSPAASAYIALPLLRLLPCGL